MSSLLTLFWIAGTLLGAEPQPAQLAEPLCGTAESPRALMAVVSGTTVTLTWQAPPGCTPSSYAILVGSAPGVADIADFSTGSSHTTFSATGVPGGTYYVRILAEVGAMRSGPSNEVAVDTRATCLLPGAPSGLSATASGTTATLTWDAASHLPASYIIEAGSASGLSNIIVFDTGSAATSQVAAAPSGTYYIRVRARNACGVGPASREVVLAVAAPTPLPSPDVPLQLRGTQVLVISGVEYAFRNRIELHDSSTLIIRNASFTHLANYAGQYDLWAYDDAKVIIENATIDSSLYVTWRFFDRASLQMTNVINNRTTLWHAFQDNARATFSHVSRAYCTGADGTTIQIHDVADSFVEMVFRAGSTVDERFPRAVGAEGYRFPNSGDIGVGHTLTMTNVGFTRWGITYEPDSHITIRDTRALVVTFSIPRRYSGLTARFDGLRATLYEDRTWTTGNSVLRLINTTTEPWSPIVSGNNALIITDSELADITNIYDTATVHIADSSLTQVRAHNQAQFLLERSYISGDVVASDNSVITLSATGVGGQVVREGNGRVILNRVPTASRGFVLHHRASITSRAGEVIAGTASIKGVSPGTELYNPIVQTDRTRIPFSPGGTYRTTFKYRILTPATDRFDVVFGSTTAFAAGVFLPNHSITGPAGQSGTATFTTTLASFADYELSWMIVGAGAILIDDIEVVDARTGAVVAAESAETVLSDRGSASLTPRQQ